jgi:hypothetical protein
VVITHGDWGKAFFASPERDFGGTLLVLLLVIFDADGAEFF